MTSPREMRRNNHWRAPTADVQVIWWYSQAQLENALTAYLFPSSGILEVFINPQRLIAQERADFLSEAYLACAG